MINKDLTIRELLEIFVSIDIEKAKELKVSIYSSMTAFSVGCHVNNAKYVIDTNSDGLRLYFLNLEDIVEIKSSEINYYSSKLGDII